MKWVNIWKAFTGKLSESNSAHEQTGRLGSSLYKHWVEMVGGKKGSESDH